MKGELGRRQQLTRRGSDLLGEKVKTLMVKISFTRYSLDIWWQYMQFRMLVMWQEPLKVWPTPDITSGLSAVNLNGDT